MLGQNRVGGYAVIWGDENHKDFDGEYFTPRTAQMTDIFAALGKLPYLYQHGMDEVMKTTVIGEIDVMQADDVGLWYEAQLRMSDDYLAYIDNLRNMVAEKRLGTSSGALPGSVRIDWESGEIKSWAIVEASATPTPADMRQITQQPLSEIKAHFKSIGLELPKLNDAAQADQITDTKSNPEVAEPETGAPVVPAADDEAGRNASAAKRLRLEMELLAMEDQPS